jgi:segregation and condensation protein B
MLTPSLPSPALPPTPAIDPDHLRLIEALLFASATPLSRHQLAERLPAGTDLDALLALLQAQYAARGVNLVQAGDTWSFVTSPDLAGRLAAERRVERRLSRAAVETLAIIAYHQPVTRAEIEQIRGVQVSKGTIDVLVEQGWIAPQGRRESPGRPLAWGTTDAFLAHFGLPGLDALPGADELSASGFLNAGADAVLGLLPGTGDPADPGHDRGSDAETG